MSDFRSVCRKHIELVINIPHRDRRMNGIDIVLVVGSNIIDKRIMPYPPSFSKMAARIIEPAIGAST